MAVVIEVGLSGAVAHSPNHTFNRRDGAKLATHGCRAWGTCGTRIPSARVGRSNLSLATGRPASASSADLHRRGQDLRCICRAVSVATRDAEPVRDAVMKMFRSPLAISVACSPLLVASGAVFATAGWLNLSRLLVLVLASMLIILWLNLSNDVFDWHTGADVSKSESIVNRTGDRQGVFRFANVSLILGLSLLVMTTFSQQSEALVLLLAAVGIGYAYQGPPFRLSYAGLGEILCFVAFGPAATNAFFMVQSGSSFAALAQEPLALGASVLVGLTTSSILLNSHYHQRETDAAAGKRSPVVRFGTGRVSCAVTVLVYCVYLWFGWCLAEGLMPLSTLATVPFSMVDAGRLCKFVRRNHTDSKAIKPAKFLAVRWHARFCLLLTLGLFLAR